MDRLTIINKVDKNIPFFREHWKTFCKMVELCGEHVEACRNNPEFEADKEERKLQSLSCETESKLNEARKKDDKKSIEKLEAEKKELETKIKEINNQSLAKPTAAPKPGFVKYSYSNYQYIAPFSGNLCWVDPSVVNPLLWFNFFGNAGIQREPTEQERFIIDCALLAVVHDRSPKINYSEPHIYRNKEYTGKYFKCDSFCQDLYNKLNDDRVQRAFERVKSKIPAETGQENDKSTIAGTEQINGKEPKNFLLETAQKVSTWIIDEVVRKHFQEQAKVFYDGLVKREGKEQTDLLGRLVLSYANVSAAHIGFIVDDDKPKQLSIPYNTKKSLWADYVLLTIIHDKRLKNPRVPMISDGIWSEDEEWVERKYGELVEGYNHGSENMQIQLELALDRVKADLEKLPVETDQKTDGDKAGESPNQNQFAIDDKELTILAELAEGLDKTFLQVEIEAATSIKRGTLKDKLPRLESIGLIHRPLGKRKGYQITTKGREIANRNQ